MPNEPKPEISRRGMLGHFAAGCAAIAGASLAGCAAGMPTRPGSGMPSSLVPLFEVYDGIRRACEDK